MTQSRAVLLVLAAVVALAGCEPLLDPGPTEQAAATTAPTTQVPQTAAPKVATTPRVAPAREQVSRGGGRVLTPEQLAAMTQARTSVSDGEIMRQLANTAERIAQQLAKGGALPAPSTVRPGTNRALGYRLMTEFGWPADQWPALDALWYRESGWNHFAENRSSGA